MREAKTTIITNKALLLGNNEFETGAIQLSAGQEIKEGAFLKRGTAPKTFELVTNTDTEEPVAIVSVDMKNNKAASAKESLRACIGGKVRADMLNVNGAQANTDQIDLIRKYGFIPIYAHDISRTEA
jgi:hypothetical protein